MCGVCVCVCVWWEEPLGEVVRDRGEGTQLCVSDRKFRKW